MTTTTNIYFNTLLKIGTSTNNNYTQPTNTNLLYINTGTINNITLSQQETIEHKEKNYEFEKTTTNIGATATISSNNTNSNIILNADKDINIMGSDILAEKDNSNITIKAGNDINISTIQDYEYERQYSKQKGGTFGTTTTREDITQSLTNINSNITASNNLSITTGNNLTSIGTNFTAGATTSNHSPLEGESNEQGLDRSSFGGGSITFNIGNDLNLYNAMDYNYEYHYLKKEKFDLGGALMSSLGANAFGGPIGMAVNAKNIPNMQTGKVDITENYDETIIGNNLNAGSNINLITNHNATLTSTNLNSGNDINILAGNQVLINTAVENDYSKETHEKYKSDLWGAFVGGAAVGIASAIGTPVAGLYATDLTKDTNQKVNISEKSVETSTNIASNINSDSNINILADKGNLISISSNIKTKDGDITLQSNNGDVMLGSATDTKKEYSREYSKGFSQAYAKFDRQAEAGVQFNEEETIKTTTTNTASVNNLEANNGNLTINSKGSIISVGSQIYADSDINLKATDGNILLTSANNSETTETQHDKTTISTGVKVGNAYVDAGYAVSDVNKAQNEVEKARRELTKIKSLQAEGKASKQAVEDAEDNLKMAQANLAYASLQALAAMASAAQVATDSLGTGFYVNAFVNYDTETTKINEQSTWQTQGNLMSGRGNINFTSGNNMTQEGTNTYALNADINYDITNNLDIIASKDTYSYTEKTSTKHAGISVGTKVDSNMALNGLNSALDLGGGNVSNKVKSTTYNNVDIIANNINIKTGNNTNIKGANVLAQATTIVDNNNTIGGNISIDTGNNLNIESLQDTYYSNSKNNNWSAGLSYSYKNGNTNKQETSNKNSYGGNGSGTSIKSNTDSQWVNDQTSIIANNNININVGTKENSEGKTTITGGLIASGSYNQDTGIFEDNGNLNLTTKNLKYKDINNLNTTTTKGSGLSTNIGTSSDNFFKGIAPNGTTSITHINEGQEKEGTTRATIGNGNITIANKEVNQENNNLDLIRDLNRNIDNSQEITKDMITGTANNTIEIDNRVITPSGWKSIYSDVRNTPGNLLSATAGAMSEAEEIAEFGREKLEKIPGGVGFVASQPFSAVEGFFDYFVENDSKAYVYDGILDNEITIRETNDIREGKNYYTNGIMNTVDNDVKKYLADNQDSVVRYNPTSGFTGDLMESTLGKLFNWNGLTAQLGSMNRTIANDLTVRKDMQYSNNSFHSQGTINGVGAMNILARNGIKLNNTQSLNAKGPAVYNRTWDNTASQVLDRKTYVAADDGGLGKKGEVLHTNITYSHNEKDPVRYLTSPRTPWDPFLGFLYGITNMKEHNISSYK